MSKPELQIAYFREYDSKNCDIRFSLIIETINNISVTKEINGFAKVSNTLDDLKKEIREKIIESSKGNKENDTNDNILLKLPNSVDDVNIEFLNPQKSYRGTIVLQDFIKLTEPKYIKVFDQKFEIITNAPLIRFLRLPTVIVAKFAVEPIIFKTFNVHRDATRFIWYKSLDKVTWEKVGEEYEYHVKESDVDHFLKLCCIPYSKVKLKGPIVEAISDNKVELIGEFPVCPFEKRHKLTTNKLVGNKFRVVSYNILADRYINGIQFAYCPIKAQGIHYRKQLIVKELEGFNADIICLQEVDDQHYKTYYHKELKDRGYKIYFNRKGNCIPEGLVCAFKNNRFILKQYVHIVLKMEIDKKPFKPVLDVLNLNKEVKNDFLKQNTSFQTVVLEERSTKKILVVGNTHLYYHPDANHIRLLQAFMATIQLQKIKKQIMREYQTNNVAIIFCGDFNSDLPRSLYGFMTSGTIDQEHDDCLKISPSGNATIYHKLHLISACGTPKYTNYTDDFKGCLDYIFIESLKLSVSRIVPVPTEQELEHYEGLPNEFYPSDHLSLVVDLEFKSK